MQGLSRVASALFASLLMLGAGCVTAGQHEPARGPDLKAWDAGPARLVATMGGGAAGSGSMSAFDASVVFADLDLDGVSEILSTSRDRTVKVYSEQGHLRAELPMRLPPSWHVDRWLNGLAVGSLTPDGLPTIIAATPAAGLTAWSVTGTVPGGRLATSVLWEIRLDECYARAGMDATPVLADIDGDGRHEIFLQVEQVGLYGIDSDGSLMWSQCWAGGNADAAVDDLDGDGDMEVVFASDSGFVSVLDAATGKPQWTFAAKEDRYRISPASIPVQPTIAELDGKAPKEILFTARHVPEDDPDAFEDYHMAIFAIHQNLKTWQPEILWVRQPDWAHPLSYTRLVVTDVDGDGRQDIFGMDWNTVGHAPGNWEHLGDAHVFRLSATGRDVWVRDIDSWWSNKDIAVGDFDGDGETEILVNSAGAEGDGFMRIDAATGTSEGFLSAGAHTISKGPTVGPIRDGGGLHIAFPTEPVKGRSTSAILLYDLGVAWIDPTSEETP